MRPVDFLFSVFSDHVAFGPEEHQNVREKAEQSYVDSWLQRFLEKHWYILFLLPVLATIAKPWINYGIAALTPDSGEEEDEDMRLFAELAQKILLKKSVTSES